MREIAKKEFINGTLIDFSTANLKAPKHVDDVLRHVAKKSNCLDRHVSAAVVSLRDHDWINTSDLRPVILASACNKGCGEKRCKKFEGQECPAVHAEIAALDNYARMRTGNEVAKPNQVALIVSYPPCEACRQRAIADGINTIVYWPLDNQVDLAGALKMMRRYQERLGRPQVECSPEDIYRQAREILLAMMQEVSALEGTISPRNHAHHTMIEESADVLFFLNALLMLFDATWEDLFQAVAEKVEITHNR